MDWFHSEQACLDYLERLRWPNEFVIVAAERRIFDQITRGINPGLNGSAERWNNFVGTSGKNAIVGTAQRFFTTGGNPYDAMAEALHRLGIKTSNADGYSSKFGLSIVPRSYVEIGGVSGLMSEMPSTLISPDSSQYGIFDDLSLLNFIREALGSTEGGLTMWISEAPIYELELPSVLMLAKSEASSENDLKKSQNIVGVCSTINSGKRIFAGTSASTYLYEYHHIDASSMGDFVETIVTAPKYGSITVNENTGAWEYSSTAVEAGNYVEFKDSFLIRVSYSSGITVDVHYFIYIQAPDVSLVESCEKDLWKISQTPSADNSNILGSWQTQSQLSALLASATTLQPTLSNLPGAALGLTEGEGTAASITLDSNAAGHGWYVDATPWSPSTRISERS